MPGTRQAPAVDTNCGGLSMFRVRVLSQARTALPVQHNARKSSTRTEIPLGAVQKRKGITCIHPNVFSSFRRLVANLLFGRRNPTPQHMKQEQSHGNSDGQA
jgi:hypothetical protein